ncbi:hypothetical protein TNCV_5020471 [Trichonephila clavipes]|nr:hypothetical protein TNCV_5020471 [Trichonephila clavipes]
MNMFGDILEFVRPRQCVRKQVETFIRHRSSHAYVDKEDAECVMISDARAHGSTREGRMARWQHQLNLSEAINITEGSSFGLGKYDTV